MRRFRRAAVAVLAAAAAAAATSSLAGPAAYAATVGAPGAGDPYFPSQGNGGYDVAHYRLNVAYRPATRQLVGAARIKATATQDLSRFDLDLRPNMVVSSVEVAGVAARWTRSGSQELEITPHETVADGTSFFIAIAYHGTATPVIDPDGSLDGFIPTDDGAFVAGEPQGAPSWFPVNDTPTDKATYDVSITVPSALSAIGNGRLASITPGDGVKTWRWYLGKPVSSYLVTATIGRFDLTFGTTPTGIPYLLAVDPREKARADPVLAKLPAMLDYYSSVYGAYPFGTAGAIVDHAPNVGYALETATRPLFDSAPDELTLAHELAHQWFGDTVTLSVWRGIWLNEGFAEFSSWLWDEHRGATSGAQHLDDLLTLPASNEVWAPPPAAPGRASDIFADSGYERGAGTLQALRERLGDSTFFAILRGWVAAHRYANATVGEFLAYADHMSARNSTFFYYEWLYRNGKPWTPKNVTHITVDRH